MQVLIIGAGGHGQVVADVLLQMRESGEDIHPIGFLDENPALKGKEFLDLPVLGPEKHLSAIAHDAVVVAVGNNQIRKKRFEHLQELGESFAIARHPRATIAPGVVLGPGCMIMAGVVVNTGSIIKENVILNTACTVDHHSEILAHAHIAPGSHLGGEVVVQEGALIGIGSTILPRQKIGTWSVVGAGSVVHSEVPDHTTVVGVPARAI